MENVLVIVALIVACAGSTLAVNCTALPDGVYERGCRSYATCRGGQVTIVDCPEDMVYNNQSQKCDDPANVPAPCGELIDCTNKADGRYSDMDNNCESWYTCQDEEFLGHNFCPEGTVFDETLVTCNWKDAVLPPCGTKGT